MKKNQLIAGIVVLAVLAGLAIWGRNRIHFNFQEFGTQVAMADWRKIAIALGCIYAGYIIRSIRWALLLRHNKKVPVLSLVGTQAMGFTAVALIGRVADLVRPYLVAKKTETDISSQIAVYIVERLSDAGAMALVLSVAVLGIPQDKIVAAIHNSKMLMWLTQHAPEWVPVFVFRFGGLVLTVCGALFLVAIRLGGGIFASGMERGFGVFSKKLGHAIGNRIRTFRTGLDTIRSFADFSVLLVLSLSMWVLIAASYFETLRAFTASEALATITPANCVLLMIVSGGASIIQLPVVGWFTQIGIVAAAITGFFGAKPEAATACAAMLLIVTFLGIVPVGLIWAQVENVSLRRVTAESEVAEAEEGTL